MTKSDEGNSLNPTTHCWDGYGTDSYRYRLLELHRLNHNTTLLKAILLLPKFINKPTFSLKAFR
jgi:hypothetical protein